MSPSEYKPLISKLNKCLEKRDQLQKQNHYIDDNILKINKKCNYFISSFIYFFKILCMAIYIIFTINSLNFKEYFGFDISIFIVILLIYLVYYLLKRIKVLFMLFYFKDKSYNYGYDSNFEPKIDNRYFLEKIYYY